MADAMKVKVDDLVAVWESNRQRGLSLSAEELCKETPELLDAVRIHLTRYQQQTNETVPPALQEEGTLPPSGAVAEELPEELPEIAGYRIERVLGRGGMGVVYLATDLSLGRQVAIKVGTTQLTKANRVRFQAEAAALARLHHTHIVQIHGSGTTTKGLNYFIMEYVSQGTLAECVGKQPQSPEDAARLIQLLAKAVQAAHHRGIIHRDLKPGNILLAPPSDEPALNCKWGCPKIADFGLVKLVDETNPDHQATTTGQVLGTPSYMAPEQARSGKVISPATDVYALGAILYMLLAGRPPFQGGTSIDVILQMLEEDPPSLLELRPELSKGLVAICEKCLAKEPGQRFENAEQLARALDEFIQTGKSRVAAPSRKVAEAVETNHPITRIVVTCLAVILDTFFVWLSLLIPFVQKAGDFNTWPVYVRILVRIGVLGLTLWGLWYFGKSVDIGRYLPAFAEHNAPFYLPAIFMVFYAFCWLVYFSISESMDGSLRELPVAKRRIIYLMGLVLMVLLGTAVVFLMKYLL